MLNQMLDGLKLMAELGDVIKDTHGNLSVRDGHVGNVYIKPSGVPYDEILPDMIYNCDIDGKKLAGTCKPSVDLPHHLTIYRANPHIMSICHTHSPYAVGFAMADENIRVSCTEHADYFGHEIKVVGYYPDPETWGEDVILEPGEKAVLLAQHGVLTFGKTAQEAVRLAAALENIAHKYFVAFTLKGRRPISLYPDQIKQWHDRYNNSYGQR